MFNDWLGPQKMWHSDAPKDISKTLAYSCCPKIIKSKIGMNKLGEEIFKCMDVG